MMSRPLNKVATWKISEKEEMCCNVELRSQLEEKKWETKDAATSP